MSFRLPTALLALLLGLGACTSEQLTHTDGRPGTNFAVYHTYNFMDEYARNDSAFVGAGSNIFDLKRAVTQQLEARGFRRAPQPDLWVNLGLMTKTNVQTRETNFRQDAPYYIGQRNYHWESQEVPVNQYQEGTVTIDLIDAAHNVQVWQGTTTSILSHSPTRSAKQIDKGVADVFARFPVPVR
ncbi:MAG: DUF4136 domain-containing protein [Janthinobacterium lividum]